MSFRPWLVAIATSMVVAACGGSSHTSTTAATATPAAAAQTTSSTQTAPTSSAAPTTSTASASAPPEVPKSRKHSHHAAPPAASQGAHVETSMTISAAGHVSPPFVAVPSGVDVEIHVTNHGSAAATVTLAVPAHPSAHIAPGAAGTLETAGLMDGTYRILVNGTTHAQLMIGAQGGP